MASIQQMASSAAHPDLFEQQQPAEAAAASIDAAAEAEAEDESGYDSGETQAWVKSAKDHVIRYHDCNIAFHYELASFAAELAADAARAAAAAAAATAAAPAAESAAAAADGPGCYDEDYSRQVNAKNDVKRNCAGCGASLAGRLASMDKVVCRGCLIANYCGVSCRKTHWVGGHNMSCKVMIDACYTKAIAKRAVHHDLSMGIIQLKRARLAEDNL